MFNPGGITLAELSSTVRDLAIVGFIFALIWGLIKATWKVRGLAQPLIDMLARANVFFDRADAHMATMEGQMNMLLNNHLSHLKSTTEESESSKIE